MAKLLQSVFKKPCQEEREAQDRSRRSLQQSAEVWQDYDTRNPLEGYGRVQHGGNAKVPPTQWAMTMAQFNTFVAMCQAAPAWSALEKQETKVGGKVVKRSGCVNGYEVCQNFVKPWTRGTGCSVALRMNSETPLAPEVMVSHTWAEDILEARDAINDEAMALARNDKAKAESIRIWFCMLAQYQCGDELGDPGPTVQQQLDTRPFSQVIHSNGLNNMVLVITSQQDPYERLWCVHELDEALDVMEDAQRDNFIHTQWSPTAQDIHWDKIRQWLALQMRSVVSADDIQQWLDGTAGADVDATVRGWADRWYDHGAEYAYFKVTLDCSEAQCSRTEDTRMIHKAVLAKTGGWERLNHRMAEFRRPLGS